MMRLQFKIDQLQHQNDKSFWLLKTVKPNIKLGGSVAEHTLVEKFTEADFIAELIGLKKTPFKLGTSATELYVNPEMSEQLRTTCFDKKGIFLYAKFLMLFEDQLQRLVLSSKYENISFDTTVTCSNWWKFWDKCDEKSEEKRSKFFHCTNHTPFITNTKSGLCLVFKCTVRLGSETTVETLTADLVLMFPVKRGYPQLDGGSLHNCVYKTLVRRDPPVGSLEHLKGTTGRDRPLTEEVIHKENLSVAKRKPKCDFTYVGIKLISYKQDDYYIIRPGQELEFHKIRENKTMHQIYCIIKTLMKAWEIEISSFTIKKVLLLRQFEIQMPEDGKITEEARMKILYEVMQHQELKNAFKAEKNESWEWQKVAPDHEISYGKSTEYQLSGLKISGWSVRINYDLRFRDGHDGIWKSGWSDTYLIDSKRIPVCFFRS